MDLRTFIAVDLESSLQKSLQHIQNTLKPLNMDVIWVKPENIHITLKFLGETPPKKAEAISKIFPDLFKEIRPFEIQLSRLGVFPTMERPNVIWVGIDHGSSEIKELAAVLEETMSLLGYPRERREFTAHLTLGRVKSLRNCGLLKKTIKDYSAEETIRQTINTITFFKSTLSAQGSIYQPLATARLN